MIYFWSLATVTEIESQGKQFQGHIASIFLLLDPSELHNLK